MFLEESCYYVCYFFRYESETRGMYSVCVFFCFFHDAKLLFNMFDDSRFKVGRYFVFTSCFLVLLSLK